MVVSDHGESIPMLFSFSTPPAASRHAIATINGTSPDGLKDPTSNNPRAIKGPPENDTCSRSSRPAPSQGRRSGRVNNSCGPGHQPGRAISPGIACLIAPAVFHARAAFV